MILFIYYKILAITVILFSSTKLKEIKEITDDTLATNFFFLHYQNHKKQLKFLI